MNEFESNPLRAENNPNFYSRFRWLGLGALAFMVYCLYDGYINYPDQMLRGRALMELAEETLDNETKRELTEGAHGHGGAYDHVVEHLADDAEFSEAWEEVAAENGWSVEPPGKLRKPGDIVNQYLMAAVSLVAALWMFVTVWRASGRWIELADDTVSTSWGQSFPLASITKIDKRQWQDKGIARVTYDHDGRKRKFVIDDYKFHRKTTDEILRRIEAIAGVDKIEGGPPEESTQQAEPAASTADATADETA